MASSYDNYRTFARNYLAYIGRIESRYYVSLRDVRNRFTLCLLSSKGDGASYSLSGDISDKVNEAANYIDENGGETPAERRLFLESQLASNSPNAVRAAFDLLDVAIKEKSNIFAGGDTVVKAAAERASYRAPGATKNAEGKRASYRPPRATQNIEAPTVTGGEADHVLGASNPAAGENEHGEDRGAAKASHAPKEKRAYYNEVKKTYNAARDFAIFYLREIKVAAVNRNIRYKDNSVRRKIVNYLARAENNETIFALVDDVARYVDDLSNDTLRVGSSAERIKYIDRKLKEGGDNTAKKLYNIIIESSKKGDNIFKFPDKAKSAADARIDQNYRLKLKSLGRGDSRSKNAAVDAAPVAGLPPIAMPNASRVTKGDQLGVNGSAAKVSSAPEAQTTSSEVNKDEAGIALQNFAIFYLRSIGADENGGQIIYNDEQVRNEIINYMAYAAIDENDIFTFTKGVENAVKHFSSYSAGPRSGSADRRIGYIKNQLDEKYNNPAKKLYELINTSLRNDDNIFKFPERAKAAVDAHISQNLLHAHEERGPGDTASLGHREVEPVFGLSSRESPDASPVTEGREIGMNGSASPDSHASEPPQALEVAESPPLGGVSTEPEEAHTEAAEHEYSEDWGASPVFYTSGTQAVGFSEGSVEDGVSTEPEKSQSEAGENQNTIVLSDEDIDMLLGEPEDINRLLEKSEARIKAMLNGPAFDPGSPVQENDFAPQSNIDDRSEGLASTPRFDILEESQTYSGGFSSESPASPAPWAGSMVGNDDDGRSRITRLGKQGVATPLERSTPEAGENGHSEDRDTIPVLSDRQIEQQLKEYRRSVARFLGEPDPYPEMGVVQEEPVRGSGSRITLLGKRRRATAVFEGPAKRPRTEQLVSPPPAIEVPPPCPQSVTALSPRHLILNRPPSRSSVGD